MLDLLIDVVFGKKGLPAQAEIQGEVRRRPPGILGVQPDIVGPVVLPVRIALDEAVHATRSCDPTDRLVPQEHICISISINGPGETELPIRRPVIVRIHDAENVVNAESELMRAVEQCNVVGGLIRGGVEITRVIGSSADAEPIAYADAHKLWDNAGNLRSQVRSGEIRNHSAQGIGSVPGNVERVEQVGRKAVVVADSQRLNSVGLHHLIQLQHVDVVPRGGGAVIANEVASVQCLLRVDFIIDAADALFLAGIAGGSVRKIGAARRFRGIVKNGDKFEKVQSCRAEKTRTHFVGHERRWKRLPGTRAGRKIPTHHRGGRNQGALRTGRPHSVLLKAGKEE